MDKLDQALCICGWGKKGKKKYLSLAHFCREKRLNFIKCYTVLTETELKIFTAGTGFK